ncbi:hypothetical protein LCGC14_3041490 [marine sediment metagenome]|uniref:Uncharacterized protein n=1 Tax=marine sediment metagenome TaxID=412755 RepID=A0A0F8YXE9_9ZZZZ
MRLYLLTRKDGVGYDEYDSKLIRAGSPKLARLIANEDTGDEGMMWGDAARVTCQQIMANGPAKVIISSFNAG